ncbi:hypothetical protein GO491_01810 [Flavobacteriaceae bacterium Ap0902]|nr:hypothetical protein [Flavobacteriaceae bacterium Ap0902]
MRLLLILFLVQCSFLSAQFNVQGKVLDEFELPIGFVNITVFDMDNKKTIYNASTKEDGTYVLKDMPAGIYNIEFYSFGFEVKNIKQFNLAKNQTLHITMKTQDVEILDDMVVQAKKPIITQTAEKLMIDISQSNMVNVSLNDVMKRIPGMLVTNDGISYAGRSDIRLLINGKTTEYMDMQTLLKDFPADQISKVELIEQPGAEFEASGSGPIVNIILTKNAKIGSYGSVKTWGGEDDGLEFGASASIANYRNKLNWQTNIGYASPTWKEFLKIKRRVGDAIYDQLTIEPYNPQTSYVGGNVDYYISANHSIGIGTRYSFTDSDRVSNSNTHVISLHDTKHLISENYFERKTKNYNLNPYYEYQDQNNKIIFDLNFIRYNRDNTNYIFSKNDLEVFDNRKYNQDADIHIQTYKADYIKEFNDHYTFRFGSKYKDIAIENNLISSVQEVGSTDYIIEPINSNRFLIDQHILSFYGKTEC